MSMFDPWMMGQNFGGILGGVAPNSYSQQDIDALIKGYGPQWGNLPTADAPQIAGDPSGSVPIGGAPPNPYGNPNALMPSFSSTISADAPQSQQQAGGSFIRPGSFFDKLFGPPQMTANAASAPQQPMGSGAEPSAVWGGPAPQMANVPMPLPRPPGLGQQTQQQPGPPLNILPPNGNAAPQDASLSPNAQLTQGQMPQAQPGAQSFNPLKSIGGFFSALDPANRPTLQETGTDPFTGQKTFAWVNPSNQTITPATMGGQPTGTGNAPGGMGQFAEAIRAGVGGQDLLKLAPPEVKNRLQAMLEGREAPPTQAALRNPQVQALINAAHAIDPTFDETSWGKRNDFIKQLQKGSNNTLGGQRNSGNTALAHLSTVAEHATNLGNTDLGGWFPGLAGLVNAGRQSLTAEQAAKANGFKDAVDRYVTEVGRYYAGSSSGGVSEREEARKRFSAAKTPQELAAAIQVERELFQGKLKQMEEQRDETLGPYAKNYAIMMPHGEAAAKSIDNSLTKLRGGSAAPASGWTVKKL